MQGLVGDNFHTERIAPVHLTDVFAHRFGGERRSDALLSAIDEKVRKTTVEGLLWVDLKCVIAVPIRSLFQIGTAADYLIQFLTVVDSHILHIVSVFHSAFNLEARDACIDQFLQMRAVVEVLQGEQMSILYQDFTVFIKQVPRQATGLGTGTTVGAAVADILAQIALSAMADAQGTMHEKLQRHRGLLSNLPNLL